MDLQNILNSLEAGESICHVAVIEAFYNDRPKFDLPQMYSEIVDNLHKRGQWLIDIGPDGLTARSGVNAKKFGLVSSFANANHPDVEVAANQLAESVQSLNESLVQYVDVTAVGTKLVLVRRYADINARAFAANTMNESWLASCKLDKALLANSELTFLGGGDDVVNTAVSTKIQSAHWTKPVDQSGAELSLTIPNLFWLEVRRTYNAQQLSIDYFNRTLEFTKESVFQWEVSKKADE